MSSYKSVLTLPQTTALLTATYPRQEPLTAGSLTLDPSMKRKKSGIGGILRTFSRKDEQKPVAKVLFVPQRYVNRAAWVGDLSGHIHIFFFLEILWQITSGQLFNAL
jgi:hypothetical protein